MASSKLHQQIKAISMTNACMRRKFMDTIAVAFAASQGCLQKGSCGAIRRQVLLSALKYAKSLAGPHLPKRLDGVSCADVSVQVDQEISESIYSEHFVSACPMKIPRTNSRMLHCAALMLHGDVMHDAVVRLNCIVHILDNWLIMDQTLTERGAKEDVCDVLRSLCKNKYQDGSGVIISLSEAYRVPVARTDPMCKGLHDVVVGERYLGVHEPLLLLHFQQVAFSGLFGHVIPFLKWDNAATDLNLVFLEVLEEGHRYRSIEMKETHQETMPPAARLCGLSSRINFCKYLTKHKEVSQCFQQELSVIHTDEDSCVP